MAALKLTETAKPGDLIEFPRGLYKHWAVYVGDGEVVHLTSPNKGVTVVKQQNISEITNGHRGKIKNLLDDKYEPHDRDIIVKDAISRVGEELPYRLTTKNCEHFATDLRYGKPESRQVRNAVIGVGTSAATLGILSTVLGVLFSVLRKKKKTEKKEEKQRKQRKQRQKIVVSPTSVL